jgi:hypothetical protein
MWLSDMNVGIATLKWDELSECWNIRYGMLTGYAEEMGRKGKVKGKVKLHQLVVCRRLQGEECYNSKNGACFNSMD